ncbi:hypothetical protein F5Y08DRAFT_327532 [Xylaria arbuscula]|nr:hypothetical protein F5Y08DRAFT_327532 [Xylaria arbuscula]
MDDPATVGLRSSGSNHSLRPISNGAASTRSNASHVASYRHALLKSTSQRKQSIEKDLPVPPVLTDGRSTSIAESTKSPEPPTETHERVENPVASSSAAASGPVHSDLEDKVEDKRVSSPDGYDHFRTWRLPVSKVRPAAYEIEETNPSLAQELSEERYPVERHFQHSHSNTPKVRRFVESPYNDASQLDPEHDESEPARNTGIPRKHHPRGGEESQKGAIYWGLLPSFKEKHNMERPMPIPREDTNSIPRTGSSYPSQASQKSLISAQPGNGLVDAKQENVRTEDKTASRDAAASQHSKNNNASRSDSNRSARSTVVSSSPSPLVASPSNPNTGQQPAVSRTAGWLRRLLGYSENNATPTLTRLPEKTSPPRTPPDNVSSIESVVATSSRESAVNETTMNNAMNDMEKILAEAISLADEASQRESGHMDDGHLPLKSPSELSLRSPSIDESIRRGSSEQDGDVVVPTLPYPVTAASNVEDETEVAPPATAKPGGLVKSLKRDGEISRPYFLKRVHKTSRKVDDHYHSVDDECVFPRPAPNDSTSQDLASHALGDNDGNNITSRQVPNNSDLNHEPRICTHGSSRVLREPKELTCDNLDSREANRLSEIRHQDVSVCSLDGGTSDEAVDFSAPYSTARKRYPRFPSFRGGTRGTRDEKPAKDSNNLRKKRIAPTKHVHDLRNVSLRNRSHVSIDGGQRFSLTKSARRQPTIARDWSPARKRFVASVACISTALVGVLVGIYAGLVPSIQYYIADFHHYTILGNVGLYLGMALPNFFCWPLPLLHGRKPYILGGLCIAMPLLFPQAIAIGTQRSPSNSVWRLALLLSRSLMGFALGFAKMNFHSILTDLFGASLMSHAPHQEVVDDYDVRRHGGGLGVWLGIWTWCFIGSIGVGFLIGAVVIEYLQPSWGLYISIIIIAAVLLLNVLCPEVRRAAWRRSVAEVRMGETISRRLARGEVMMHRVHTGPKWWGQEVYHGVALSLEMLRQPGFTVMAVYSAWIYAQIILLIVLLGSLTSKSYRYRAPYVGAVVSSVAIGALLAIPFQKANVFSQARHMNPTSNKTTFDRKITWTSHLVRRAIFTLVLPIAGIAYTAVSTGPPMHVVFPSIFAALIGFLSCLAISECNGMLMENWDCSDLQPGMTGRSKTSKDSHKRTNYSSFPRATAGWNFIQSLGFIFAAGATGLGGSITRSLGQRTATGVVAGILFILTLLLLATFTRFKRVQIIPDCTCSEMDRWTKQRRVSLHNWAAAMAAAKEKGKELNEIPEDDAG